MNFKLITLWISVYFFAMCFCSEDDHQKLPHTHACKLEDFIKFFLKIKFHIHLVFPNKCWNPKTRKAYKVGEDFFLTRSCHKGTCRSDFSIGYVGYD